MSAGADVALGWAGITVGGDRSEAVVPSGMREERIVVPMVGADGQHVMTAWEALEAWIAALEDGEEEEARVRRAALEERYRRLSEWEDRCASAAQLRGSRAGGPCHGPPVPEAPSYTLVVPIPEGERPPAPGVAGNAKSVPHRRPDVDTGNPRNGPSGRRRLEVLLGLSAFTAGPRPCRG